MNYTIVYEAQAEQALQEMAFYYIEQVGLDMAITIMDSIVNTIQTLSVMPERCQKSNFSEHIHKFIIQKPPYSVYFCIMGQKVVILEILHNKKDQRFLQEKYKTFQN